MAEKERIIPDEVRKFIDLYTDPEEPALSKSAWGRKLKTDRKLIADWIREYKVEIDAKFKEYEDMAFREIQKSATANIRAMQKIAKTGTSKDAVRLKANESLVNKIFASRSQTDVTSGGAPIAVNFGVVGEAEEVAQTGNG